MLAINGVSAHLSTGVAEAIPAAAGSVDCVVAVSALEFVDDLPRVCGEVARVLRPGGRFIVVTPAHSLLADAGKRPKDDFGDRRERLRPTLLKHFRVLEHKRFPRTGVLLYDALALR